MENIEKFRLLMESIEPHFDMDDSDSTEVSDEPTVDNDDSSSEIEVAANPMDSLKSIMSSIKALTSALQNGENVQEITSGLHNIASSFSELSSSVAPIEENYGADGMEPKLVKVDGDAVIQVYNDPNGDSYAARNGFVG